jgi:MFS family permease
VLGAFALAIVSGAAFVVRELRTPEPMLDIRFFRNARFTAASVTVMLSFFALIGFVFMATQYLQFVLGYTPLEAGLRTLPYAGAMIIVAPLSSKVVDRFGTKRVVVSGMLLFSVGLLVASTSTVTSGYGPVALAMVLMGTGMGLVMAPATDSIMGALPPEHAGVGSAMNDTTREVGAALGVAVIGSLMSSFYAARVVDDLPAALPAPARDAASDSLGAAVVVGSQLGRAGTVVVDAGREAFVYAMSRASWVAAAVGLLGALLAWRYLPARAEEHDAEGFDTGLGDTGRGDAGSVDAWPDDTGLDRRVVELAPQYGPLERCEDDPDCVERGPAA